MVYSKQTFAAAGRVAHAAPPPIPVERRLAQTAEILIILPLERVARVPELVLTLDGRIAPFTYRISISFRTWFRADLDVRDYPALFSWLGPGFVEGHVIFTREAAPRRSRRRVP